MISIVVNVNVAVSVSVGGRASSLGRRNLEQEISDMIAADYRRSVAAANCGVVPARGGPA